MLNSKRLINSFKYALEGISYSLKLNQNIRIHLLIALFVIFFSFVLSFSPFEFLTVAIMIVLVISAEMINSSIEEVVNLLVKEHREEAKIAKDVSAGMVLFISIFALAVGIILFLPHIIILFK